MTMDVGFKEPEDHEEYRKAPVLLRWLFDDFVHASVLMGVRPICTRILGKIEGDSGVHADYRGIDFRFEYLDGQIYTEKQKDGILDYLNGKWPRNDGKKTAFVHSFQGGPKHFHLQLPVETKTLWSKL